MGIAGNIAGRELCQCVYHRKNRRICVKQRVYRRRVVGGDHRVCGTGGLCAFAFKDTGGGIDFGTFDFDSGAADGIYYHSGVHDRVPAWTFKCQVRGDDFTLYRVDAAGDDYHFIEFLQDHTDGID